VSIVVSKIDEGTKFSRTKRLRVFVSLRIFVKERRTAGFKTA